METGEGVRGEGEGERNAWTVKKRYEWMNEWANENPNQTNQYFDLNLQKSNFQEGEFLILNVL